jgi:4-amino-4-deoxy-L-arabinose transferase-like glycosyltransferase
LRKIDLDLESSTVRRWFRIAIWPIVGLLSTVKFCYLSADFPNDSLWMIDQAKYTDEGWWASGAVRHFLTGHWSVAGDYNPAVALPVWPGLLGVLFHFTGVSVVAARALNVAISTATLGVVFALVRQYSKQAPALIAVLLLASSPFAFVFNRLAILDTLVVFEFCVLMLVASFASEDRWWPLASLTVLVTAMILTKTTAALLVPAVLWLAWARMGYKRGGFLRASLAGLVAPAVLLKGYELLVRALGYGGDYEYFFDVNGMPDIDWRHSLSTLWQFLEHCLWIDRVLFPVGLVILVIAVAWKRRLWRNPLFAASWTALAAQAVFIFSRQDDYAPRYFLVMLAPLIWIVALTFGETMVHARRTALAMTLAMAAAVIANGVMIHHFLIVRDYDFRDAALSIRDIVRSHPEQKPLLIGASANQLSIMVGVPAINDGYGTEDMREKLVRYQPGWYVGWNDVDLASEDFLSGYRLQKIAIYEALDDDDRGSLTLYKMVRR